MSQQSQQSRNTRISRGSSMDTNEERTKHLMSEIEEMREGIIAGMSLEALERARIEPDFLKYLRDLIELGGEAEAEVAIADANLRTAQDDMVEATSHRDQIAELRQRFERGNLESMDYVDAVDLLRRAESPDADNVPDERLESGDESGGGEGSEALEEIGEKRKRKGKSKAVPKKPRVDREERDDSSEGCNRCKERQIPCIVLQGKTACDACHQVHTKCSLQLQSRMHLLQKKASRVVQALAELGLIGAEVHRPASQVSSRCRQIDSRTGEFLPEEISQFEEMRRGLVNTQRRLRELERNEAEHKRLDEEHRRRRQQRREERAARAARIGPEEAGEPQRGEGSGRAGRSASSSARPASRPARSRSRTGVALLESIVPVVSPVNDTSLIRMTVKKEEDEDANLAEALALKKRGEEQAARKKERKERAAREEAEKKAREQAAIDAEIQKLMVKKAELNAPVEPKEEPVEGMVPSADFMATFPCPPGFRLVEGYLVIDEESDAHKDIDYELEYVE
ncbi:hypothetical protein DFH08DRAFT_805517 [Mycena albidolilacea]|uniref:Uncharacterized protein n=1 Tax=Mycena albidolilacea TaxID=1033008 RepID=A0AAD7A8M8_9AGAR|nr:hypothetical protein DFH08DRAFT_805517 [Mycena albidolilacea]